MRTRYWSSPKHMILLRDVIAFEYEPSSKMTIHKKKITTPAMGMIYLRGGQSIVIRGEEMARFRCAWMAYLE